MLFIFFFQAEDGIRVLVRSRGLGDVYKSQGEAISSWARVYHFAAEVHQKDLKEVLPAGILPNAVSYTHLTLPTSDLV